MISVMIPGKKLLPYLSSMTFPVEILAETGNRKLLKRSGEPEQFSREDLLYMMHEGLVVGFGSWKRIRVLRVCRQLKQAYKLQSKLKWRVTSEAGKTVIHGEPLADGVRPWKHHPQRCGLWRKGMPRIDGGAL